MLKIGSLEYIISKSNNPIDSIDDFFNIFLNLGNNQKNDLILFLSKNISIDKNFYPILIKKIYHYDKELIKNLKIHIIVETYNNFKYFYYEFLNILCLCSYDFTLFEFEFRYNYHPKTKKFFNETLDYINLNKNIRDF